MLTTTHKTVFEVPRLELFHQNKQRSPKKKFREKVAWVAYRLRTFLGVNVCVQFEVEGAGIDYAKALALLIPYILRASKTFWGLLLLNDAF